MKFLIDSVILIDHLNNIPQATAWLSKHYTKSCISAITRAETLTGVNDSALSNVILFLDNFTTLPITANDADLAAELRREHKWKLPDAMQAALALNHHLILITRNTKDFVVTRHHFVRTPYKI